MKKRMTVLEAKEFLQTASAGHLSPLSIITATPKEFMIDALWIDKEAAKTHTVCWGKAGKGMSISPKFMNGFSCSI
jgi:hypothetical protein